MSLLEPEHKQIVPLSTRWKVTRVLFVVFSSGPWFLIVLAWFASGIDAHFNPLPGFIFILLTPWSFLLTVAGPIFLLIEKADDSSRFWWVAIAFAAGPLCIGILIVMLGLPR